MTRLPRVILDVIGVVAPGAGPGIGMTSAGDGDGDAAPHTTAHEIIAAQAEEIGQMQRWRQTWFPLPG